MPANPKYLTTSRSQRFAKISAGIIGGYLIALELHYVLALIVNQEIVLVSMRFTMYLVWVTLMFIPFIFRNGWKCWAWYGATAIILSIITYLGIIQ